MSNHFVTIIIPTYKDWGRLSLCINALSDQKFPAEDFEVIIVNNHSSDLPPDNFTLPDNFSLITESKPGSYAARNAAILRSKGSIIGFTDSDCIPDQNWIQNAVAYFISHPDCKRIAGKISLFYRQQKLTNVELYETVYAFNQHLYVKKDGTSVTANMFTYKNVLDEVGIFDEKQLSGGDYEWNIRAKNAGFKIDYVDNVIVKHPARYYMHELTKKARRVGGGQASFNSTKSSLMASFFQFVYDLRPPVNSLGLIATKGSKMNFVQKSTVFFIRYYLNVLSAYEKFKVSAGKKPVRA